MPKLEHLTVYDSNDLVSARLIDTPALQRVDCDATPALASLDLGASGLESVESLEVDLPADKQQRVNVRLPRP